MRTPCQSIGPGTVAVVTGAASGIGRAIASALVERGGSVVLADVDVDRAHAVAAELDAGAGSGAMALPLDVTDPEAFDELVGRVLRDHGRLDCLVNNAGIAAAGEAQELSLEHWNRVLSVNLHGTVHGIKAAYPIMVAQGHGHIVNVASVGGLLPMPLFLPYNTSKFGVSGLTLGLRAEAATHGVRVTLVCPGVVETNLLETTGPPGLSTPPSAPDVRSFVTRYMGRPRPASQLAARILDGIERNRPVVIFPRRAQLAAGVMRVSPRLVLRVTQRSVRQEQVKRGEQFCEVRRRRALPVLGMPWKTGSSRSRGADVVVSATRTEIHRWRDLPGIIRGGHRLRRAWPEQPGAIALKVALQPLRRVSWTVSLWETEGDLKGFVRSPLHVAILTPYRPHLTVRGTKWSVTSVDRRRLWTAALHRLALSGRPDGAPPRERSNVVAGQV